MKTPENWLDAMLPFPRPEYVTQPESLLTDLLWRSPGSSLSSQHFGMLGELKRELKRTGIASAADPTRLVPRRRHGGNAQLTETFPLAESIDLSTLMVYPTGIEKAPTSATLLSLLAPRARGNKSDACVPVHPSTVLLQTLHGLTNKESPANLAIAIETMGWLGGAGARGHVASSFLNSYQCSSAINEGSTGFLENLLPAVACHVWNQLPENCGINIDNWPVWSALSPIIVQHDLTPPIAQYQLTPFAWFWRKWNSLCDPANQWQEYLPARRFVDWSMCLLRTGLAFSYLWEAEFYSRVYECIVRRATSNSSVTGVDRLRALLEEGGVLGSFEPPAIPANQKGVWQAISELLARGYEVRQRLYNFLDGDQGLPAGTTSVDILETWVNSLSATELQRLTRPLNVSNRTANNQKEFVRYLLIPRSSNDDVVDQADFYYLAQSNSRHLWLQPGPEWLVVVTGLLCEMPGRQCTLRQLVDDLTSLGVRVERSVLVSLLEEAGLSTDSPDADNALIIRSGF